MPIRLTLTGVWLISSSAAIVVVVVGDNAFSVPASDGLEARSSELEATAYSVRRPNDVGSPYVFGYDNAQDSLGNEHFRYEERFANGTVIGEYGFTDNHNSAIVTVTYVADENGFRPIVKVRRLKDAPMPDLM